MNRVLQNAPATISASWYEDGVLVDPGAVTVKIDRANGTNLIAAGTATVGTGAAARTYTLSAANTALLDRLTVTWTSPTKGVLVTYVEIVGGFLFRIDEALADNEIDDNAADIATARTMAEQAFEDVCGVAFVPRYEREINLNGDGSYTLPLRWPRIRSLRAASVDATALTVAELATVVPQLTGVYYPSAWTSGYGNVIAEYEHGFDFPPPEVSRAVLRLAKHYLTEWSADDRALRLDTEAGSYVMAVAGRSGSDFGIPEVDAVAQRYSHQIPLA